MLHQAYPHTKRSFTLNINGKSHFFDRPIVMGILNITDDSFYDGGAYLNPNIALKMAESMLELGAKIIDIGASSSRPGSQPISVNAEIERLLPIVERIAMNFPEALISIDTFRAEVATLAIEHGAHIINDISAGDDDIHMLSTIAKLHVPYIAMHKQGSTKDMQQNPQYEDVTAEVCLYFTEKLKLFKSMNITDVIIDPGFGFGKTVLHNYQLLRDLSSIKNICERPILVGLSRKSMITKILNVKPAEALNGTTALHMLSLISGANILRVHDVKEAIECIQIAEFFQSIEKIGK